MKRKFMATVGMLVIALAALMGFAACSGGPDYAWKAGPDTTEYAVAGHTPYAPTYTIFVKIVANEDVLYDGTVTLTSDDMWASESTSAALSEKGLAQDGLSAGFVNKIGDYENKEIDGEYMYWNFGINGVSSNWGCNQIRCVDGTYLLWGYIASTF